MKRVSVFCGSSAGRDPAYLAAARDLGSLLARRGLGLVYGGGRVGLMGALADAVLAEGGEAIGVIPEALSTVELAHHGLTELRIVRSMHERKATMADLADAFLALPGGLGTFEEILEMLTWAQLGIHARPCGILDVRGYYAPLTALIDRAVAEGFVREEHREMLLVDDDAGRLLDRMESYSPPIVLKWIEAGEA
ncbi:MAG: TIGR00730 family Rossman fold protein [Planctomycetes bacterium]|nr:TIGR00730 family Rossman fold protein [Planctomycetota bacterium]